MEGTTVKNFRSNCLGQRHLADVQHALGHGVGKERFDGRAGEIIVFGQRKLRVVGAARADGDQFRLRLMALPEIQHIGIDLLIDDPLFAGVSQAKIARLRPRGQVINAVVLAVIKIVQVKSALGEIAIARIQASDIVAVLFQAAQSVLPRNPDDPVTRIFIPSPRWIDGKEKFDAGVHQMLIVRENFLLEIPCQHVIDIRRLGQFIFNHNRNVHAGRKQSAAKSVFFHKAFDQIGPNAEIIQQRVTFHRGAHAEHAFAWLISHHSRMPDSLPSLLRCLGEIEIGLQFIASAESFLLGACRLVA